MRRTRLLATLGPASDSPEVISALIEAGADTFRLNMSHSKHEWCRQLVPLVRELANKAGRNIGILFDLQGPSIRTGVLEEPYQLKNEDRVEFRVQDSKAQLPISTTVNYEGILQDVSEGDTLIVDNGTLIMDIESIQSDRLIAVVKTPGELGSRRHINLPGVRLNLPSLTEKDHKDIILAVECSADYIAGSFVRDARHVQELRTAIQKAGGHADLVSKLEDQEAIRHLDDIIDNTDIIMVARGDLGIEVHIEELPIIQRRIVKQCIEKGKRVIVATHMLESMISTPTPTRAEITDVSNAVFEEADAIMLSGETSIGKYPVRCMETLDRVARRIELAGGLGYASGAVLHTEKQKTIRAAISLADSISGAHLLIFTRSGSTANQTALLRPRSPIYAFTPNEQTCRTLTLSRGIRAFYIPFSNTPRETISTAIHLHRQQRDVAKGTPLIIVSDTLSEDRPVFTILVEHA